MHSKNYKNHRFVVKEEMLWVELPIPDWTPYSLLRSLKLPHSMGIHLINPLWTILLDNDTTTLKNATFRAT